MARRANEGAGTNQVVGQGTVGAKIARDGIGLERKVEVAAGGAISGQCAAVGEIENERRERPRVK